MLLDILKEQKEWSQKTFGEGKQTEKICKHIIKELDEVRENPDDLMEWVDVILLSLDGAWRAGYSPIEITQAILEKQHINRDREWVHKENEPSEHKRL